MIDDKKTDLFYNHLNHKHSMEVGKTYNICFSTGKYDFDYETNVKCIKITPKSYRVERPDGITRLIRHDSIGELKEV